MAQSPLSTELWAAIRDEPAKEFWIGRDGRRSYGDLAAAIETACGAFEASDAHTGGVVLIVTRDDWLAAVVWFAALLDGRVPALLAPDAGNDRLAGIADLTGADISVTDTERATEPWTAKQRKILRDQDIAPPPGAVPLAPKRRPSLALPDDGMAFLVFTSGTTSAPKGVVLTHENLRAQLQTIARVFEVDAESRLFNGSVLYHVDGLVQGPVLAASRSATLIRPEPFSPTRIEDDLVWLSDTRATHMVGAPALYDMIDRYCVRDDYFARPEFHAMLSSAARLAPALWHRLERRFGKPVINEYGMTETVAATHFAGPHAEMGARSTIGKPIDCEAKLGGPEGQPVAPGDVGELLVRGPNIFPGYFGLPEQTAKVFEDGWFRTGDLCRITGDGDYEIVGRMSTAINFGGFLIRPEEIDEVVGAHPLVRESQTLGMDDPGFGQVPVTAAVADLSLDLPALAAHCRERLEARKVPKHVVQVDAIPRLGSGKPDLGALRDLMARHIGQGGEAGDDIEAGVIDLAARIFQATAGDILLDHGPDEIAGWDSYTHTVLALEAEDRFGVRIDAADVLAMNSLADLAAILRRIRTDQAPGSARA